MVSDANDKNEEDNQEETVDQAKDKEKEVKITLYDNGIPEKCAEKMVTEMFKDWMEQKPTSAGFTVMLTAILERMEHDIFIHAFVCHYSWNV